MSQRLPLNQRLADLLPEGAESVVVPDNLAQDWLAQITQRGWPEACAHGHPWTIATARVRVRDRTRQGKGITVERDCRVCKHEAYALAVSRKRHQMKGGRLT